jgi:peptide deformylase
VAILPVYLYGQPVLRKKAKVVRHSDEALATFVQNMFDTMHKANGIGLAANQVGSLQRVIVVDVSEMGEGEGEGEQYRISPADRRPIALINPEVVAEQDRWTMEEGCLSIPEIREEVERPETIRVRYKDVAFNDQELEASGLLSRVILHEIDHLNGVLFIDKVGIVKRKLLRGRLNKIAKGEVEVSYPAVSSVSVRVEAA